MSQLPQMDNLLIQFKDCLLDRISKGKSKGLGERYNPRGAVQVIRS